MTLRTWNRSTLAWALLVCATTAWGAPPERGDSRERRDGDQKETQHRDGEHRGAEHRGNDQHRPEAHRPPHERPEHVAPGQKPREHAEGTTPHEMISGAIFRRLDVNGDDQISRKEFARFHEHMAAAVHSLTMGHPGGPFAQHRPPHRPQMGPHRPFPATQHKALSPESRFRGKFGPRSDQGHSKGRKQSKGERGSKQGKKPYNFKRHLRGTPFGRPHWSQRGHHAQGPQWGRKSWGGRFGSHSPFGHRSQSDFRHPQRPEHRGWHAPQQSSWRQHRGGQRPPQWSHGPLSDRGPHSEHQPKPENQPQTERRPEAQEGPQVQPRVQWQRLAPAQRPAGERTNPAPQGHGLLPGSSAPLGGGGFGGGFPGGNISPEKAERMRQAMERFRKEMEEIQRSEDKPATSPRPEFRRPEVRTPEAGRLQEERRRMERELETLRAREAAGRMEQERRASERKESEHREGERKESERKEPERKDDSRAERNVEADLPIQVSLTIEVEANSANNVESATPMVATSTVASVRRLPSHLDNETTSQPHFVK